MPKYIEFAQMEEAQVNAGFYWLVMGIPANSTPHFFGGWSVNVILTGLRVEKSWAYGWGSSVTSDE